MGRDTEVYIEERSFEVVHTEGLRTAVYTAVQV